MPLKHATRNRFHGVRRRIARSVVLCGLFLLLAVSAVHYRWSLDSFRALFASSVELYPEGEAPSVNTDPSSSLGEEVWRMRLRRMHRRQERLVEEDGLVDRPSPSPQEIPLLGSKSSSSVPPKLVSSGFDMRGVLLLFLALYTGVLHGRARRRMDSF